MTKHGEGCFESDYTPVEGEGENALGSTTIAESNEEVRNVKAEGVVRVNAALVDGVGVAVVQETAT